MSNNSKSYSNLGVVIILIGIVMMLVNFNIIKLSMFWGIVDLWPVLFILLGFSILFKKTKYLNIILWLIFIAVIMVYSFLNIENKSWSIGETVLSELIDTVKIDKNKSGLIDVNINQGSLNIIAADDNELQLKVPVKDVKESYIENKLFESALVKIEDEKIRKSFSSNLGFISKRNYEIFLPKGGSWTVEVDAGVLNGDLDLSKVSVKELDIDAGVLDIEIAIGNKSEGDYSISAGVGDIFLSLPKSIGIKIDVDGGLKSVEVDLDDFDKDGSDYISKNYDDSKYQINLSVDLGVGNIEIEYE